MRGMKCGVEGGKGMEVESERNEMWGGGIGREWRWRVRGMKWGWSWGGGRGKGMAVKYVRNERRVKVWVRGMKVEIESDERGMGGRGRRLVVKCESRGEGREENIRRLILCD